MIFIIFFASQTLAAQPVDTAREKTAFESALEQNQFVQTEERIVNLDGRRYREVSYQNKKYYYRFMEPEASIEVDCSMDSKLTPSLTEVGVTIYKRSKVFVQLLRETCLQMPAPAVQAFQENGKSKWKNLLRKNVIHRIDRDPVDAHFVMQVRAG